MTQVEGVGVAVGGREVALERAQLDGRIRDVKRNQVAESIHQDRGLAATRDGWSRGKSRVSRGNSRSWSSSRGSVLHRERWSPGPRYE